MEYEIPNFELQPLPGPTYVNGFGEAIYQQFSALR